jgi:SAM-dependent methyltransferase
MKSLKRILPESFRNTYRSRWEWWKLWIPWRFRKLVGKNPLPINPDGRVLAHLGCGGLILPGFVNVDSRPLSHIHYLAQVQCLPFFDDGSVDVVYVVHCLEHLPFDDTVKALKEWHRVLKTGGMLYVATPDLDRILDVYNKSGRSIPLIQQVLMGGQTYPENFHYAVFNEPYLAGLLGRVGFVDVARWEDARALGFEITDCSSATLPSEDGHLSISLNLMAMKGGAARLGLADHADM